MPTTPIRTDDHGYLQESRAVLLRCVDGLDEYSLRHPMTPTGTNLLGVIKHLIGIEAGYLGACLGHPFGEPLPWIHDETAGPNRDMWATATETSGYIIDLYGRAAAHSDAVLAELGTDAAATVPWWPRGQRETTSGALLARVLKDTAMHAGQLQILREQLDGMAGSDRHDAGDDAWWDAYCAQLEDVAQEFRSRSAVELKPTDATDFAALRRLFDHPSFAAWGGSSPLSNDQLRAKYLGSRLPDVECFLVVVEELAIGLALLHVADDVAGVSTEGGGMDLILLPQARGRGVGRTVVAELVRRAHHDRGWQRITVDPDLDNKSAIGFWRAVGFEPEQTIKDEPGRKPYLIMVWSRAGESGKQSR